MDEIVIVGLGFSARVIVVKELVKRAVSAIEYLGIPFPADGAFLFH